MVLTDGPACKIDCFPLLNSKYSQLTKTKAHNQKREFEFAVKASFWGIFKKRSAITIRRVKVLLVEMSKQ